MEESNRRIEENARRIDYELRGLGRSTVAELETRTKLPTTEILLALGWLAREERIILDGPEIRPLNSGFYF